MHDMSPFPRDSQCVVKVNTRSSRDKCLSQMIQYENVIFT